VKSALVNFLRYPCDSLIIESIFLEIPRWNCKGKSLKDENRRDLLNQKVTDKLHENCDLPSSQKNSLKQEYLKETFIYKCFV